MTMKDVKIIVRRNNAWETWTKFSLKKKKSTQLQVIHNFISINSHTIKSQYLIHRLKKVINILIKLEFMIYFINDAVNNYWRISMRITDINKIEFLTFNNQWIYFQMNQELKKTTYIYSQFLNLVFNSLSANEVKVRRMLTILNIRKNTIFSIYMNDHVVSVRIFDLMFKFLHKQYFSWIIFKLMYLFKHKTVIINNNLYLLEF